MSQYVEDSGNDFIATELLGELKAESARKSEIISNMQRSAKHERFFFITAIILVVAGFLLYLNQYDFSSTTTTTTTNNAEGVYAVVDSEGNTIASDLTPEEVEALMKEVNADGNGNQADEENGNP